MKLPQSLPLHTVQLGYRHSLVPEPKVAGQAKHLLFPANEILIKALPAQLDSTHSLRPTHKCANTHMCRHPPLQGSAALAHTPALNPCSPRQGLATETLLLLDSSQITFWSSHAFIRAVSVIMCVCWGGPHIRLLRHCSLLIAGNLSREKYC